MEPIDYLGALRRSWRLLLVLGLVGLIVAVALPVSSGHGKKHVTKILEPWSASAIVGAAPPAGNTLVGGGVTGSQIVFYATSTKVQAATAKLFFGKNAIKPSHLSTYLKASLIVPKGVGKRQAQDANTVNLTAFNTSAKRAKRFANDYAHQVGVELNRIAASHVRVHSTAVSKASSGYQIVHPALTAVKHTVKKSAAGPVKSRKVRGLIGLGIGVVLAAVIVLMREVLSKRLRTVGSGGGDLRLPGGGGDSHRSSGPSAGAASVWTWSATPDRRPPRPTGCCACRSCSRPSPPG